MPKDSDEKDRDERSSYSRVMTPIKDIVGVLAGLATILVGVLTAISWFTNPSNGPVIDGMTHAVSTFVANIVGPVGTLVVGPMLKGGLTGLVAAVGARLAKTSLMELLLDLRKSRRAKHPPMLGNE